MNAAREALLLPVMFLTVTLAGGLSLGPPVSFSPPPLFALILAALLVAALFRSGVLVPAGLVDASRGPLANVNGAGVIVTLFAASAQVCRCSCSTGSCSCCSSTRSSRIPTASSCCGA